MADCLIGLGSNLGSRAENLDRAVAALRAHQEIKNLSVSAYRATKPIGGPIDQSEFLNAAIRCETSLVPQALLDELHAIELQLGRTREVRWSARTIDLDLLLYDREVIETASLVVPHPRMAFRRFVLEPADEIAREMIHATTGFSVRQLLTRLDDAPNYIAITGGNYADRALAARQAATMVGGRYLADPVGTECEGYIKRNVRPPVEREVEIIHERQAAIRDLPKPPQTEFVISDFWLGESLVLSMQVSSGEEFTELTRMESTSASWRPKLVVLLRQSSLDTDMARPGQEFERRLEQHMHRPGQFPLLVLQTMNPIAAAEEVAAAVLAMQR